MTDKQLKRLRKIELLEIMIAQDKEIEELRQRLTETERRLQTSDMLLQRYLRLEGLAEPPADDADPEPRTGDAENNE